MNTTTRPGDSDLDADEFLRRALIGKARAGRWAN